MQVETKNPKDYFSQFIEEGKEYNGGKLIFVYPGGDKAQMRHPDIPIQILVEQSNFCIGQEKIRPCLSTLNEKQWPLSFLLIATLKGLVAKNIYPEVPAKKS
jgi:hypothetical protein